MNIQPIVEGHGEVTAVPVLLRRLRDEARAFGVDINPPIRRKRSQLVQEAQLRRSIQLARLQPQCGGILVLLDSDKDCPSDQAALSAEFDMKPAYQQCRSFRRMVKAFGDIVVEGGAPLGTVWPPVGWQ